MREGNAPTISRADRHDTAGLCSPKSSRHRAALTLIRRSGSSAVNARSVMSTSRRDSERQENVLVAKLVPNLVTRRRIGRQRYWHKADMV